MHRESLYTALNRDSEMIKSVGGQPSLADDVPTNNIDK